MVGGYREISEGKARILVPDVEWRNGPNTSAVPVFYNPTMEMNRDISVSVLRALRPRRALDGMAATGIRGIRFALETDVEEVHINDRDPVAMELIERNVELNAVEVFLHNDNINVLTEGNGFDYIDIDPFGTPVGFLDSAIRSLTRRGVLAVSATDTAVLCGAYPKVCRRRYLANPLHNWCMHEAGLRILIGYVVRMGAMHDRGLFPILSYSADHYFRAYFRMEKGARKADGALSNLSKIGFEGLDMKESGEHGPMWMGELHEPELLEKLEVPDYFGSAKRMRKMLELWKGEVGMPPCFHESHEIASELGVSAPTLDAVLERIKERGHRAERTHFSPTGFKSDAPMEVILSAFGGAD